MLGIGFLNEIVSEGGEVDSSEILNKLRKKIIKSLEQHGEERKDGMDIALCVLNRKNNELQFSGAYNPLFLIRKNTIKEPLNYDRKLEEKELILYEFKADKMPIGKFQLDHDFSSNKIQLESGDTLYSFSDGFPDQFGGEEGKKYMTKKMKKLFLDIQSKTMDEQHNLLHTEFDQWLELGGTEQIDDVCIVGVKI